MIARLICTFALYSISGVWTSGYADPPPAYKFSSPFESTQKVTLLFVGDAMQHQVQIDNALQNGKYDYSSYFQYVTNDISAADLAVVNLEVTLGGKPYKGYPMFSAPDEYATAIKEAGFDVFLTANNHCLDRYSKGLIRTISVLDSLQVKHTGTFSTLEEKTRHYPLMITKNGIRFSFLNYTYGTNGLEVSAPNIVNYIDKEQIKKDIQNSRLLGADIVIANMHWGDEYKLVQNREQEALAKFLVAEGVDLIIGSHPHVIQPSKVVRNEKGAISNLIVYSMGNFISGMQAVNTDGGQMVKVSFSKKDFKTRIDSCSYSLIYVDKQRKDNRLQYSLLPVKQFETPQKSVLLSTEAYNKMMIFAKNARTIFSKHNEGIYED